MATLTKRTLFKINGHETRFWSRSAAEAAALVAGLPLDSVCKIEPDKPWRAQVRRQGFPAKTKTFRTKRMAEDWITQVESGIARGGYIDPTESRKARMSDLIDRYEKEYASLKRGYGASEKYRMNTLRAHFGKFSLAAVDEQVVLEFIRNRRDEKLKDDSILRDLTVFQHVLETCKKIWKYPLGWLDNPVGIAKKHIKLEKSKGRKRRLENAKEQCDLLNAAANFEDGRMLHVILFAIEVAMRRGELAMLVWDNVRWDDWIINMYDSKNNNYHDVPLSPIALTALESLREMNLPGNTIVGYAPSTLSHKFNEICLNAEIKDLRLHDLRREGASRLIEMGLSVIEVASVTGHTTLEMLQRYVVPRANLLAKRMRASAA